MKTRVKKYIKFLSVSTVLVVVSIFTSAGQNYIVRNYTTENGLSHNNDRCIVIDKTGFLWAATWDGLNRFDGYDLKNYYHIENDSTSLPFFSIENIIVDSGNNLWILTDHHDLVKYNRETDNFSTIRQILGVSTYQIVNICTDNSGNIIIACKNEILRYDDKINSFKKYNVINKDGTAYDLELAYTYVGLIDEKELWLTGSKNVSFEKVNDTTFSLVREYRIISTPLAKQIDFDFREWHEVYLSPTGKHWIFSNRGLYCLDTLSGNFLEYRSPMPAGEFTGKKYFCWAWRNEGIFIYNSFSKKLLQIPGSQAKYPLSVFPVADNSIWFSNTSSKGVAQGLHHFIVTPDYFTNYPLYDKDSSESAVYSVTEDNRKRLWVGARGTENIRIIDKNGEYALGTLKADQVSFTGHIRSLSRDSSGIWIGYYRGLLRRYDYSTGNFKDFYSDQVFGFRTYCPLKNGKIVVGSDKLYLFDPVTGKVEILWISEDPVTIFKILLKNDSILYAAMSSNGFVKYDLIKRKGTHTRISQSPNNAEDVIMDKNGNLWFATLGNGVCRYNESTGEKRFYTTSDGLSNNTTYNLLEDKNGYIWVSTNAGISKINPVTGKITIYGLNEGVKITEFNSGAKFITDDGKYLFGGMGGLISFDPDSVSDEFSLSSEKKIILTSLKVSGFPKYSDRDINSSDTIILEKGENNFYVSYSTTDFINARRTHFRYMLPGIDEKWINAEPDNRNINYSNLNPGWYNLKIQATDYNGDWNISKQLVFRIKPRFWETWLFIITAPVLIIGLVVFSVLTYIRQLNQKQMQVQNELKLQSLRGQMNPHFIFNSLNSINYFISNNDRVSANRYIGDFSRLIRSILANLGNNYVPIENELTSIEDYLKIEHLRFSDKFEYEINVDDELKNNKTEVCPGLVQPLIENAIWHGVRPLENRKGYIKVNFKSAGNNKMICIIDDNGIGRQESLMRKKDIESHRSKGLQIVNERLQVISKIRNEIFRIDISDLNNDINDTGTRVIVEIPINILKQ